MREVDEEDAQGSETRSCTCMQQIIRDALRLGLHKGTATPHSHDQATSFLIQVHFSLQMHNPY